MVAGPNGLLGLIAQNQFDSSRGDETSGDLERLLAKVRDRLKNVPAEPGSSLVDSRDWKQRQRAFEQDMRAFRSPEKGAQARREEMRKLAQWAEEKAGWPNGSLQQIAVEAMQTLGQSLPRKSSKKNKPKGPQSR